MEGMITEDLKHRIASMTFGRMPCPARAMAKMFEALPEDAIFLRTWEDPAKAVWGIHVLSKTFAAVKEGDTIPELASKIHVERDSDGTPIYTATIITPIAPESFMDELESL